MNSFWKITRGEMDKIFVRPAIFVMTGFFVLAIVISTLMFAPSPRADITELTNIEGKSVVEVYTTFNSNQHKQIYDSQLENNLNILNAYSSDSAVSTVTKEDLTTALADIKSKFETYQKKAWLSSTLVEMNTLIDLQNDLKTKINELNATYRKCNENYLQLLIVKKNNELTINLLNDFAITISVEGDEQDITHHQNIINSIDNYKFIPQLEDLFSKIEQVSVSENTLNDLKENYYDVAVARKNDIWNQITTAYSDALINNDANLNLDNIEDTIQLCDNYKLLILQTTEIINDKILLEVVDNRTTEKLANYTYSELSNFNKYQTNENLVRNQYYFANEAYSYEFANVFQSNTNSNYKTNAYDFMYYALEFLSFIIIIFCVVIGAGMISGEIASGTMKMLAIRPYKRSKIVTGKLMATLLIGVIFLIIGATTTFIIGFRLYGLDSAPVLLVFNAESVTTISALSLFFIFLASLLVRIILYTTLALFISTVFKSNVAAVIISVMIYVFVALFGNIFGESVIYGYLPFANVDLFRYLGGEFVASSGNILGLDFSCPIQPDSNFYISLAIVTAFVALLLIVTYIIFKKRDID